MRPWLCRPRTDPYAGQLTVHLPPSDLAERPRQDAREHSRAPLQVVLGVEALCHSAVPSENRHCSHPAPANDTAAVRELRSTSGTHEQRMEF